jgi:predicted nucleic acid-binding Zn ribbon protein
MPNEIEIKDGRPVRKCPYCGADTPLDSVICVKCGKAIRRRPK